MAERLTYFCETDLGGVGEYRVNENGIERSGPSVDLLAMYENTGVAPDDISSRQKEIIEAERDGRLVILPEPCEDIDWFHLVELMMYDSQDRLILLPKLTGKERDSVRDFLWDCLHGCLEIPEMRFSKMNENEREAINRILDGLLRKENINDKI